MKRKVLKTAAFISAMCIMMTFSATGCQKKEENTLPVLIASKYQKRDLSDYISISGTVESTDKNSVITTELLRYKVSKINYKVGDHVNPGDIVCELDSSDLEREIADTEKSVNDSNALSDFSYQRRLEILEETKKNGNAQIAAAEKAVNDKRNEYNEARNRYNEKVDLYNSSISNASNAINQAYACEDEKQSEALIAEYNQYQAQAAAAMAEYEQADAQMKAAEISVTALENNLEQTRNSVNSQISSAKYDVDTYKLSSNNTDAQRRLDDLRKDLENTKIKATKSGIISAVNVEEGKMCSDGIIMNVQSDSDICVHVVIEEEDLLKVQKGMRVSATISAKPGEEYDGTVDRIVDIMSMSGFDGYISINEPENFKVGMTSKVKIYTVDEPESLTVKNSAIFENKDKKKCVYEAEQQDDGSYKAREVEITESTKTKSYTAVTGEGLEEGDLVITIPKRCKDGEIFNIKMSKSDEKKESNDEKGDE